VWSTWCVIDTNRHEDHVIIAIRRGVSTLNVIQGCRDVPDRLSAAPAKFEAEQPTTSTHSSVIFALWTQPLPSPMSSVLLHGVLLLRG
jgi:hypothetical protein